jgi:hypothetical protein
MDDTIGVPREGVASFSDDGHPARSRPASAPRLGHGFNQIHQEQKAGADNSIMTTTPSVADVLGGPPGVFPDDINLAFNEHVRHHLVHFPDIAVRPGGMTFGPGHGLTVPEADRYYFTAQELKLQLTPSETHLELWGAAAAGLAAHQPVGDGPAGPSDIGIEAQHAFVTVTDPLGAPG